MTDLGWWRMWERRREIDEFRQWTGWRRGRAGVQIEPLPELPRPGFEAALVAWLDVQKALAGLPPALARVLAARAVGYTSLEVARVLGTTPASVDSMVWQARRAIHERPTA